MKAVGGFVFECEGREVRFRPASEEEALRSTVRSLLLTRFGERPMRENAGSHLWEYLFRPMNEGTLNELKNEIREAVERSEGRLQVAETDVRIAPYEFESFAVHVSYQDVRTGKAGQVKVVLNG
jgi:phage baseplate assembly protein W